MKGNHIGALQKLLKIHPLIGLIRISSGSRIIDHMAAKGLGNGRYPLTDGSHTDNPPGLPVQLGEFFIKMRKTGIRTVGS